MVRSVDLKSVRIRDTYWDGIIRLIQDAAIPYQWEVLNDNVEDAEPSHVIRNFRIAAGLDKGEFYGMVFQDSDLAKWIEAAAYSLILRPDPELEAKIDQSVELLGKAQQPDGYLDTYFIVKEPGRRWKDLLNCHELYCAGHLIEAGVAYYQATGKDSLLKIVSRYADYIDTVFGKEPGKIPGYPGHPEIELALARLYDVTGNERYLKLSKFFVDERGTQPSYFDREWARNGGLDFWTQKVTEHPNAAFGAVDYREYNQFHRPVREQAKAAGHAVRALYLYTGMADVAARTGDETLLQACKTLWDDIVNAQMYVTGGVGSTAVGEAFTFDYDLPNDTIYAETCASVALVQFARAMFQMDPDAVYADVIERALYNILPASMQRDGRHFYYANPMEVWPERCERSPILSHIKPVRQKWFACACCPPNLARTVTSLARYIFSTGEERIYLHQFIGCEADLPVNGHSVRLEIQSNYPASGNIALRLHPDRETKWTLCVRKPGWCQNAKLFLNGEPVAAPVCKGYWELERIWLRGDLLTVELNIQPVFMRANRSVRADAGMVCLTRGPVVYCFEEADNGTNLSALRVLPSSESTETFLPGLPEGTVALTVQGLRDSVPGNALYTPYLPDEMAKTLTAVPYAVWGNRTAGEMRVWMRV